MGSLLLIAYVLGIVIVIFLAVLVVIYNTLVRLRNNIRKAWANIDVLLEKRYDLIGKLVDTVKGYEQYERTLLVQITSLRTSWSNVQGDTNTQNKMTTSNQISQTLKTLFANVENYPNLKADQTFLELQQALVSIENQIADRREFYNDTVNEYNIKISVIPFVFFSGMLKYSRMQFFEAPEASRGEVNVDV